MIGARARLHQLLDWHGFEQPQPQQTWRLAPLEDIRRTSLHDPVGCPLQAPEHMAAQFVMGFCRNHNERVLGEPGTARHGNGMTRHATALVELWADSID